MVMCYTENILKVLFPCIPSSSSIQNRCFPSLDQIFPLCPLTKNSPATRLFWFSVQSLSHVRFFATSWTTGKTIALTKFIQASAICPQRVLTNGAWKKHMGKCCFKSIISLVTMCYLDQMTIKSLRK